MNQPAVLRRVRTSVLDIAYEESGPADGIAVLLMHGFPYDPRTYDEVVSPLVETGCRVIAPYLRGYGATRFLASDTLRSGQQAALGNDLIAHCRACGGSSVVGGTPVGLEGGVHARRRVAGARTRPGLSQRLQHPRHCRVDQAGVSGAGVPALVSILLSHRTGPCGIAGQSPRVLSIVVAVMIAKLAVR